MSAEEQESQYGPAPGELELVREFVNTVDIDDGTEELTSGATLAAWLADHGIDPGPRPDQDELGRAIGFREGLRQMLLANNGEPLAERTAAELGAAARRGMVELDVDGDGVVSVRPAASGVDGLVARMLAIVGRAQIEGTWRRLKACPAETCAWAFYDESRNCSRTWCSMGVCGNRAKTRRYRSRRRARGEA